MTLRSIINKNSYKKIFNFIYKIYYSEKNYANSDVVQYDISYLNVFNALRDLSVNDDKTLQFNIKECKDCCESKCIDVTLFEPSSNETFACDFCPWSELIDIDIVCGLPISEAEIAAHILWEITFWGFSEEKIREQSDLILKNSEEIEDFNLYEL